MNAKQLMDAMNEIDDSYIRRADPRRRKTSGAGRIVWGTVKWAGGIAAALALVFGLIYLGHLQTPPVSPAGAGSGSAEIKQTPTPLEDLPQLEFPVHEDWAAWLEKQEYQTAGIHDSMAPATSERFDDPAATAAALWGQDRVTWEGLDVTEKLDFLSGGAEYLGDGSLMRAVFSLVPAGSGEPYAPGLILTLSSGGLPTHLNDFYPYDEMRTEIYGTPVTTSYYPVLNYNEVDSEETMHVYEVSFLTEGGEPIGVRAQASCKVGDETFTDADVIELLTRLTSQCLRPGNTFTLRGLAGAAVSIDADGVMGFADPDVQEFYEHAAGLWGTARALTGGDAAEYAGDENCTRVVSLLLPELIADTDIPQEDGSALLFRVYQQTYGFLEEDGHQVIRVLDQFTGAPMAIQEDGGYTVLVPGQETEEARAWFAGVTARNSDQLALDEAHELTDPWKFAQRNQAENLLRSYMEQNGLANWEMETEVSGSLAEFGTQTEEYRAEQAALRAQAEEEMLEAAVTVANDLVEEWVRERGRSGETVDQCFYKDLRITNERRDGRDDVNGFIMSLWLVFKPEPVSDGWWWSGNVQEGEGDLAGYYLSKREVQVNLIDGQWQFGGWDITLSKDGFSEPGTMSINLGDQLTQSKLLDLADKAQSGTLAWSDLTPYADVSNNQDLRYKDNGLEYYAHTDYYIRTPAGDDARLETGHDGSATPAYATLHYRDTALDLSEGRTAVESLLTGGAAPLAAEDESTNTRSSPSVEYEYVPMANGWQDSDPVPAENGSPAVEYEYAPTANGWQDSDPVPAEDDAMCAGYPTPPPPAN